MSSKQLTPIRAGGRAKSIMPETFEDVQRIAAMAVKSELFKPAKKDEQLETTVARCALAIMVGLDAGLSPAQSIQSIAVINGRCMIWGQAVPGILWAHGFDIEQTVEGDGDQRKAVCTITRPNGKKITRSFSVADAKKARLWDDRPTVKKKWNDKWEDKPNDSPWFRFGERMLGWRALGFAKSDGASDVMMGLEIRENDDSSMIDVTPNREPPAVLPVPDLPEEGVDPDFSALDVNQDPANPPATVAETVEAVEPIADPAQYLAHLDGQMADASTQDELDEAWSSHNESTDGRLSKENQLAAEALFEKHYGRINPKAKKKGA